MTSHPHILVLTLCALPSLVLWRENARRGEGLVSVQLCHRDHKPHRTGEQRATHEAPAQGDQCLETYFTLYNTVLHQNQPKTPPMAPSSYTRRPTGSGLEFS